MVFLGQVNSNPQWVYSNPKKDSPPERGKLANLTRKDSDTTFEPSMTKGKRKDRKLLPKGTRGPDVLFLRNQTSFL